ncbi:MAG: sensor histidine kinase, partial [Spirochaetota bacterium]
KKLQGNGCATYHLKADIRFPEEDLGLRICEAATAYRIWINGSPVAASGLVGNSSEMSGAGCVQSVIRIPPDVLNKKLSPNGVYTQDIVIQVSNFCNARGGIWKSVILGNYNSLFQHRVNTIAFSLFFAGMILMAAVSHFWLFLLRRRDRISLFFCIFIMLMIVWLMVTGERPVLYWFPELDWSVINRCEYFSGSVSFVFLILFLSSEYHEKKYLIFNRIAVITGAVLGLFVLFAPSLVYTALKPLYIFYTVAAGTYGFIILITALMRKRESSIVALIVYSLFFITVINSVLNNCYLIQTGNAEAAGILLFVLCETFILSRRFSGVLMMVEKMTGELAEKNRELREIDKTKDEFFGATSRDLSTPLSGIISIAEAMVDGASGPMTDSQKYQMMMIHKSSKRLLNHVNDIVDFANIRNGQIVLQKKPVDVYMAADLILMISKPLLASKGVQLSNKADKNGPLAYGDENRIQQILQNLVENAIRFTDKGSIEISSRTVDSVTGIGKTIEITVSDTGAGISSSCLKTIFESYVNEDGTVSRVYTGNGLGLAITKKLVEMHGGEIRADSEEGKGSHF